MNLLITLAGTFFVFLLMKLKIIRYSVTVLIVAAVLINTAFRLFVLFPMQYYSPAGELRVMRNSVEIVPRVQGQVTRVFVSSQDEVTTGQPLLAIDSSLYEAEVARLKGALANAETQASMLEERVESAKANLEASRQQLKIAESQFTTVTQQSLESAVAATRAANATFLLAQRERERAQQLFEQKVISAEEFDNMRQQEAVARNNLVSAQAAESSARIAVQSGQNEIESARQKVELAESALRQANLNFEATSGGDNPLVAQAKSQLAEAELKLEWTTVTAPIAGRVLNVQLTPGQQVGTAPVIALEDASSTKYYIILKQSVLRHVAIGDNAEMFFDLYPGTPFYGKVKSVAMGVEEGRLAPTGSLLSPESLNQRTPFSVEVVPDDAQLSEQMPTGAGGIGAVFTDKFKLTQVPRKVINRMLSYIKFVLP